MFSDDFGKAQVNYIGDLLKEGPKGTTSCDIKLDIEEHGGDFAVFAWDNIRERRRDGARIPLNICDDDSGDIVFDRHFAPPIMTCLAEEAFNQVLSGAGIAPPVQDPMDQRIVEQMRAAVGGFINHPDDRDGWPELGYGEQPADVDEDGMPDAWQASYDGIQPRGSSSTTLLCVDNVALEVLD